MTQYEIYQPHPSLTRPVTPEQRDRAEAWLHDAFMDGRMSQPEYEHRLGQVMTAETRGAMNAAFLGLAEFDAVDDTPDPVRLPAVGGAARVPAARVPGATSGSQRGLAALAHFSYFFSWMIGAFVIYRVTDKGSYAKREAAKALNWQLFATIGMIVGGILSDSFRFADHVMPLFYLAWLILTIIGGVRAARGQDWTNPVMRLFRFKVFDEGPKLDGR